jgi:hypothetical protein
MKRVAVLFFVAIACAGIGWATYRASAPPPAVLSKFVPEGSLLYLEAQDFSSLIHDWNSSEQRKQWIQSDNYEVFSRSRLFLRLKGAGDQFAAAAGLPADMDFLSQVAGEHSVLALYDIGKLQFLYITYLPSAKAMQTTLWQMRAKFEPRNAGGVDFYLRRDPQSQREVAFAVSGDYLLLATREDLMAGALQLLTGKQDHTIESEPWWAQATAATGRAGDLRMVLNLQNLVPNGYFRTYWVQQNITDLSQYSAAVSDLFRTDKQYREERVLISKQEPEHAATAESLAMAADLSRLIPDSPGVYEVAANPTADGCFALLENKLLAPHIGSAPASQFAPQVQLTAGEPGSSSDLETQIDVAPAVSPSADSSTSTLKVLLARTPILASLQLQSTERDAAGVFVRIHSVVVFAAASDWSTDNVHTAIADFVRPSLTTSQLGVAWLKKSGYEQFDGLWPLSLSVRGKYLIVSDDPKLLESILNNFVRKPDREPLEFYAGFNHQNERENFARFTSVVDRPNAIPNNGDAAREPQFFSGNMASLSKTLQGVAAERIEIRTEANKVRQTVTYEWSQ